MTGVDVLAPLGDAAPRPLPGIHGYDRGWEIPRGGTGLCRVYEGRGLVDHVVVSGADSPEVARAVRTHVPGHLVTRADVCVDFDSGPSFYGSTREQLRQKLTGKVTLTDYVQTARTTEVAATFYMGSKASETRVRLYEKGKEDPNYPADTVRLELQARPEKAPRREWAASMNPDGFWGIARWSRMLASDLCGITAPAPPPRSARVSDVDKALDALAIQYGRRLLERAEQLDGDLEALALDILRRIPETYHA